MSLTETLVWWPDPTLPYHHQVGGLVVNFSSEAAIEQQFKVFSLIGWSFKISQSLSTSCLHKALLEASLFIELFLHFPAEINKFILTCTHIIIVLKYTTQGTQPNIFTPGFISTTYPFSFFSCDLGGNDPTLESRIGLHWL